MYIIRVLLDETPAKFSKVAEVIQHENHVDENRVDARR